ncbi:RNase H1/viroplasmin domain-containing protein, partial [Clostridiaceae bacterium HSG29]|nr:RNase H1/viroplasmin domain-containing protein [Clostridiaceae bacterium HSG29]
WDECKKQVHGYKGAEYKSFKSLNEAENYLNGKKSINQIYGEKN